ncbi:MAG: serine hydrolase [Vulcanimicrobiaceae bacterium]
MRHSPSLVRRIAVALLVTTLGFSVLCTAAQAGFVPGPLMRLHAKLARLARNTPGRVAFDIEDLTTGYTTGYQAGETMPAASTIKVPVMVEVFKQMEAGDFDFNTMMTLYAHDRDYGWGQLAYAPLGSRYSVRTLLGKMIDESDNTAANMLIRLVGRNTINATMRELGFDHTVLRTAIRTQSRSVRRMLQSSPADMTRLLALMAQGKLIDPWASAEMISILEGQQLNTLLPEPLPQGLVIAHKTGSLDHTLDDVGIVYAQGAPYVVSVMTTDLPSLSQGRRFIRDLSLATYDDLEAFARWRQRAGIHLRFDRNVPSPGLSPDLAQWTDLAATGSRSARAARRWASPSAGSAALLRARSARTSGQSSR